MKARKTLGQKHIWSLRNDDVGTSGQVAGEATSGEREAGLNGDYVCE